MILSSTASRSISLFRGLQNNISNSTKVNNCLLIYTRMCSSVNISYYLHGGAHFCYCSKNMKECKLREREARETRERRERTRERERGERGERGRERDERY